MAYTTGVRPETEVGAGVDTVAKAPSRRPDDTAAVLVTDDNSTPRGLRRRRTLVIFVAVVVAAGAAVGIWLGTRNSRGSSVTISNKVVGVTTGTMQKTVTASGTIEPVQEADLNFDVSGVVTAVDVQTGQTVSVGQALASLDPSALQSQVDAAKETLLAAQEQLTSDREDSASTSQIDTDEAQTDGAQTALTSAEGDLADATLSSTIAGTVASVDLSVGQEVTGGGSSDLASSSDASTDQVVVVSTSSFLVSTKVDDTKVRQVMEGQAVEISSPGSSTKVDGTVSSVGLIASGGSGVATFPVTVAVTGSPSGLYAGASATVSIIVQRIDDAVEVPTAAISYSPGGEATVTMVGDGRHVTRSIVTGVSVGGETQVTSGLSPGDKVLERVVIFNGSNAGGAPTLFGGNGGRPTGPPPHGQIVFNSGGPPGG
jgi:RND family efflux transporter MFP subunit